MKITLDKDQEDMVKFLGDNKRGILAVGMGRGKTAAMLKAIRMNIADNLGAALVVAPMNVINLTWPGEIEMWDQFKSLRFANLRKKEGLLAWHKRSADIYLINWEMLPKFALETLALQKGPPAANIVVYDELSKAKSHKSKRVNMWRRFTSRFDYHWGATGTPNPNGYEDLFAQFRLIFGSASPLGKSHGKFRDEHMQAVDYHQYKWELKSGSKEQIQRVVAPYMFSLGPGEFPINYIDVDIDLPPDARRFYKQMAKDLLAEIGGKIITAANAAVLVMKLIQVTSGSIYDAVREVVKVHDWKVNEVKKIQRRHKGEPILLVTMFKHERESLRKRFPEAVIFDGETKTLHKWNDRKIPILIIDPRSAGHGLNMQRGGSTIVWNSLTYSRELYDQTNARLARRGQEGDTNVYRLICKDTVDEAVSAVLETKGAQQAGLLTALKHIRTQNEY